MSAPLPRHRIRTRIWQETPEAGQPFVMQQARCHGYDVFGQMVGRARWVEILYLLFRGERPTAAQAELLELVAVALANPGPRDPAVHAAMGAGACGSTAAATLMAALAVGAGQFTGARELHLAMVLAREAAQDLPAWSARLDRMRGMNPAAAGPAQIWPTLEHPPGFDPHVAQAPLPVRQLLAHATRCGLGPQLPWLQEHREALEAAAGGGLNLVGVAAAAFVDLGCTPDQGEMLHLLLRLPGAAAHALEQRELGHRDFPLFELDLADDPGEVRT